MRSSELPKEFRKVSEGREVSDADAKLIREIGLQAFWQKQDAERKAAREAARAAAKAERERVKAEKERLRKEKAAAKKKEKLRKKWMRDKKRQRANARRDPVKLRAAREKQKWWSQNHRDLKDAQRIVDRACFQWLREQLPVPLL